jgi:hypothetical protein
MTQEELRKFLVDHKEGVERGRRMTPAEIAKRRFEHNTKKKEEGERRGANK